MSSILAQVLTEVVLTHSFLAMAGQVNPSAANSFSLLLVVRSSFIPYLQYILGVALNV